MAETVLVTTHDLPLAGQLRTGFRAAGHRVDLVTAYADADSAAADSALVVLTAGLDAKGAEALAEAGRARGVPVFAVGAAPAPGLAAAFAAPADPEEVVLMGCRAIDRRRLRAATGIVGETDAMIEVLERVVQIAPVDVTVLVTGESGTGKELVARGLHALSARRGKAFIAVNVAALTETLLESELFGHEKGAFTGAIDSRRGLFELAAGGTIFLDEIGEMPLQTQTKLLRVLEQQEFLRVGGQKTVRVDVRIVAATNQHLRDMVAAGTFRKDLYYRLNVLHIGLPPLRNRREDIPLLVEAFVQEAGKRHDRGPFVGLSGEAMDILVRHRWPGNVRELRNLVESMVVLAPGKEIRAEDIPSDLAEREPSTALAPLSAAGGEGVGVLRPQLEFVFRTMMQMKVDIEDLRTEFEAFRQSEAGADVRLVTGRPEAKVQRAADVESGEIVYDRTEPDEVVAVEAVDAGEAAVAPEAAAGKDAAGATEDAVAPEAVAGVDEAAIAPETVVGAAETPGDGDFVPAPSRSPAREPVVYTAGMTLEDAERATIRAALAAASGNRRLAAESLGIGERTLYRKINTLGLEDEPAAAGDHDET